MQAPCVEQAADTKKTDSVESSSQVPNPQRPRAKQAAGDSRKRQYKGEGKGGNLGLPVGSDSIVSADAADAAASCRSEALFWS